MIRPASLVLGIDPGTAVTGFGVVERDARGRVTLVECGVIRTVPSLPLSVRIRDIYEGVAELIERHRPTSISVEDVFLGKNSRSALSLGHARGAILLAAALRDLPISEYTPREIKKAVAGNGGATKEQVAYMVQTQLRLRAAPAPADAVDGVAAALCHCLAGTFAR